MVSVVSPYAPIRPPVLSSVPSRLEVQCSTETSSIVCPRATHRVRVATCRVWLAMRCIDVQTVMDWMQGHRRWSGRKMEEMEKDMMKGISGGEVNGAFCSVGCSKWGLKEPMVIVQLSYRKKRNSFITTRRMKMMTKMMRRMYQKTMTMKMTLLVLPPMRKRKKRRKRVFVPSPHLRSHHPLPRLPHYRC